MTLVVAKIVDRATGRIILIADTKLTYWNDEAQTRRSLHKPGMKVVIISDTVAVGVAGDDPERQMRALVALRGRPARDVISAMVDLTRDRPTGKTESCLVAATGSDPQLVAITNGTMDDRTSIGTAWIGDPEAFREFSGTHLALDGLDVDHQFVGAAQAVITKETIPSVGGFVVRAQGSRSLPFQFRTDYAGVMPWLMNGSVDLEGTTMRLRMHLPPGGDPSRHTRLLIPGRYPTIGSVALFIPQTGIAWLHRHSEPWADPIALPARTVADVVAAARTRDQFLDGGQATYSIESYGFV